VKQAEDGLDVGAEVGELVGDVKYLTVQLKEAVVGRFKLGLDGARPPVVGGDVHAETPCRIAASVIW